MPDRNRATWSLTVRCRCEGPRKGGATRDSASTPSGRTLLGPEPNRPSTGLRSSGIRIGSATGVLPGVGQPLQIMRPRVPALDLLGLARLGSHIAGARAHNAAEPLLPEDGRPPA